MDRGRHIIVGYALVLAGAVLFSSKAIFAKLAFQDLPDAVQLVALRMAFSLPAFAAVGLYSVLARRRAGRALPSWRDSGGAFLSGILGYYLAMIFDFEGLIYISAQLERLVLFVYPVYVMVLGALFFRARLSWTGMGAAAVTFGGLAVVFGSGLTSGGPNVAAGTALVTVSAICFAFYQLFAKKLIAAMGSVLFTTVSMSGASVASLAHYAIASGGLGFTAPPHFIMLAAATGLFATVIPAFLVNAGLARVGPQVTAMISTVSPLATIYLAIVVLGERFTLADALGTALVIGGIGFYTWHDLRRGGSS